MAEKKPDTKVFSPERFGRKLREERRLAGYKNTKELSEAIQELTDTFIDFDTLMKYERGEREPDVSKIFAIAVTLYGSNWADGLRGLLAFAIPDSAAFNVHAQILLGEAKEYAKQEQAIRNRPSGALGFVDLISGESHFENMPIEAIDKVQHSESFRRFRNRMK